LAIYPYIVLPFGAIGLYVGLENLVVFWIRRRRLHLWVGLLGLTTAPYALASFGLYSASGFAEGGRWQLWQLLLSSLLANWLALLGLDYLGKLRRAHVIGFTAVTVTSDALLWIPGVGLTDVHSAKTVPWLGVTYYEWTTGLAANLFYGVAAVTLLYVAVSAVGRAWRGTWAERTFAGIFALWFLAAGNDMAISAGLFHGLYVVEYTFALMAGLFAALLFGELHRAGVVVEQERRRLAAETLAIDRRLATAQAELVEAAQLAAVGRLAAGVAHEVNNPLTYVIANVRSLAEELPAETEHAILAREALHGAERIKKLVRQLSAFARPAGECGSACVEAAVETAAKMASVELKDRATLQLDLPELPGVAMDEGRLAQVLLNLLVNAAQSIPLGQRAEHWIRVAARRSNATVVIVCEDSGAGIADEALPNIFEPFFSTKPLGTGVGLGLSISREIVTRAGGTIRAENIKPSGARFTLELPVAASDGRARTDDAPAGSKATS
jgi:signal transduction histidine kinase